MFRNFAAGLFVALASASAAFADPTCPTGTWTDLMNGNVADASQVMTNFNCLAPLVDPIFSADTNYLILQNTNSASYGTIRIYNDVNSAVRALELDYTGSAHPSSLVTAGPGGEAAYITATGAYPLVLSTSNTARMVLNAAGNVGIGTTTPAGNLDIYGASNASGISISGNTTGLAPSLVAVGSATDLGLNISSKGVGTISFNTGGGPQFKVSNFAGATDYLQVGGGNSTNSVAMNAFGADTNIGIWLASKGTGPIFFVGGGSTVQARVTPVASAADYLSFSGGIAGSPGVVTISTGGSDTNVSIAINPKGSGNVGIGTSSPAQKLEVNGQIKVDTLASASATSLCINSNVLASCSSSIRYKEHVKDAQFGLKEVLAMRPVTFKWKGRDEHDFGFIAEEIAKIDPRFATYKDGRIEGVKYPQLTAVLAKAVQQQQTEIAALHAANAAKTNELNALKKDETAEIRQIRSEFAALKTRLATHLATR